MEAAAVLQGALDSCGWQWVTSLHYGLWQVSIKKGARASFLSDDFIWLSKQTAVPHQVQRAFYLFFNPTKGKEIPKGKIAPVDQVCSAAVVVSASWKCSSEVRRVGKTRSCAQPHWGAFMVKVNGLRNLDPPTRGVLFMLLGSGLSVSTVCWVVPTVG